jgi:hypothetical protein
MPVGRVGLGVWSFVMSSAHGTGLMLVPILLGWPVVDRLPAGGQTGMLVVLSATVHVTAMLIVMASGALVVY